MGDRLGVASPAHIRAVRGTDIFPVLAQQSIRELTLTKRTFRDVISAACWAVFQEDYKNGFGADGDHLKTFEEVETALAAGVTMVTLDCSEHINNDIYTLSSKQIVDLYSRLPADLVTDMERRYLYQDKGTLPVSFDLQGLQKIALIYYNAIRFIDSVYCRYIKDTDIALEISIDETLYPTDVEAHFFVSSELYHRGVSCYSMAPRFCGEFQKGIDYIGDIQQFAKAISMHREIADYFGYKISVHSGSDKFSVFPIIANETQGQYHLKTAGTHWLESVRMIALKDPELFRELYGFIVQHVKAAKKYYHIKARHEDARDISLFCDQSLPELICNDDIRQLMHISYGLILCDETDNGKGTFKTRMYALINKYERENDMYVKQHVHKHLQYLNLVHD